MLSKLWFQQGQCDPYLYSIPTDIEYISEVISLIHMDAVFKAQLQIPKDCGAIKLCRSNGNAFSNGHTIANLLKEDGFINNSDHPIVVQITSSRATSKGDLCESDAGSLSTVEVAQVFKRQRENPAKWKPELPLIDSPEAESQLSVNQSHFIGQLHEIHMSKYERAISSVGDDWVIPLVGNGVGLQQDAYSRYYIHKSRDLWSNVKEKSEFQRTLVACHTVRIAFQRGQLLGRAFDSVVLNCLIEALKPLFEVEPDILTNPPPAVHHFLDDLTQTVGPVFVVLDGIGAAFTDDDLTDNEMGKRFQSFCRNIVGKWQSIEKVFFVVLGQESYLRDANLVRLS